MSNRLTDLDSWSWEEYVESVILEFIWLTEHPLVPTQSSQGALTACFHAGNCPFCAAKAIAVGMGFDVGGVPHPSGLPDGSEDEDLSQ